MTLMALAIGAIGALCALVFVRIWLEDVRVARAHNKHEYEETRFNHEVMPILHRASCRIVGGFRLASFEERVEYSEQELGRSLSSRERQILLEWTYKDLTRDLGPHLRHISPPPVPEVES